MLFLVLQKHKDKLSEEKKQYEARKGSHIRELKRILDEESSQFNKFQVLNERYSLLNLLGKGGFSEVFKVREKLFSTSVSPVYIYF